MEVLATSVAAFGSALVVAVSTSITPWIPIGVFAAIACVIVFANGGSSDFESHARSREIVEEVHQVLRSGNRPAFINALQKLDNLIEQEHTPQRLFDVVCEFARREGVTRSDALNYAFELALKAPIKVKIDLSGVHVKQLDITSVSNATFVGVFFDECSFTKATIRNCDFTNAKFTSCAIQQVTIRDCVFDRTTWSDCTIRKSTILSSQVLDAKVRNCGFEDTKLLASNFTNTELLHSHFFDTEISA